MAWMRGVWAEASAHFTTAIELFEGVEMRHAAARVIARLGETEAITGAVTEAIERMEGAYAVLAADPPDADLAALAAQLARWHAMVGSFDVSEQRARAAVNAAEALQQHDVISQALNTQASIALSRGNREESLALYTHALRVALDHDITSAALRSYNNLANLHAGVDNWAESLRMARDGLALARRVGDRLWEYMLIGESCCALFVTGGWDEASAMLDPIPGEDTHGFADFSNITGIRMLLDAASRAPRFRRERARRGGVPGRVRRTRRRAASTGRRERPCSTPGGGSTEALAAGRRGMRDEVSTIPSFWVKEGFAVATAAAVELGDIATVEELLAEVDSLPPGRRPPALGAHVARIRGRLAASSSQAEVADREFARAVALLTSMGAAFWAATARVEWAEALSARGASAEAAALVAQATTTLRSLGATPWLERVGALAPALEAAS